MIMLTFNTIEESVPNSHVSDFPCSVFMSVKSWLGLRWQKMDKQNVAYMDGGILCNNENELSWCQNQCWMIRRNRLYFHNILSMFMFVSTCTQYMEDGMATHFSLVGYCLWGHKESDLTEQLRMAQHIYNIFILYIYNNVYWVGQ